MTNETRPGSSEHEVLRERFRITERRDGAVYRTESEGMVWIDPDVEAENVPSVSDRMYVAPSTDYDGPTIRRKRQ
jgi:hypothetical protein